MDLGVFFHPKLYYDHVEIVHMATTKVHCVEKGVNDGKRINGEHKNVRINRKVSGDGS